MNTHIPVLFSVLFLTAAASGGDGFLGEPQQLTFNDRFAKAGEAYFSPDGSTVIFQAVERVGEDEIEDPFYAMFLADFVDELLGRASSREEAWFALEKAVGFFLGC